MVWWKRKIWGVLYAVSDVLRRPAYAIPLVINLTGSVWFFLLIGQAGEFPFFFSRFVFLLLVPLGGRCCDGWSGVGDGRFVVLLAGLLRGTAAVGDETVVLVWEEGPQEERQGVRKRKGQQRRRE